MGRRPIAEIRETEPTSCPGCRDRNRGARQLMEPWYTCPLSGDVLLWQCLRCGAVLEWGSHQSASFVHYGKENHRVVEGWYVTAYQAVILPHGISGAERTIHGNRKEARA